MLEENLLVFVVVSVDLGVLQLLLVANAIAVFVNHFACSVLSMISKKRMVLFGQTFNCLVHLQRK